MVRLRIIVPACILLLPAASPSQEKDLLSWSRLGLSLQWSYHFAPWDDLNRAYEFIDETVRIDPYFQSPSGSYQAIRGDGTLRVLLSYTLAGELALVLQVGYTRTQSSTSIAYIENNSKVSFTREVLLGGWTGGIGVAFEHPFTDRLRLRASAFIERTTATLHVDDASYLTGSISSQQGQVQSNAWGTTIGGRLYYCNLLGPLGVEAGVEYRFLRLPAMVGAATFQYTSYSHSETRSNTAYLAQSATYFGIVTDDGPTDVFSPLPGHILGGFHDYSVKPAGLDLSAWGVTLGVVLEF